MSVVSHKHRVGTELTAGPIMKTLLTFAVPIILSSLVQQMYSMVDLIVIGHYVGSTGTVGVNIGSETADLLMPVALGFSSAGQIYLAQLVGAKSSAKIKSTIGTLLTFMLMMSVIVAGVSILFADPILRLLNCPLEAFSQAKAYMIITALATPFVFGYNAICAVLRAMGESRRPLQFVMIAATINIFLDLLLVVVFPLEAAGTAIATAASQMGAFAAAAVFLWKKREHFGFELKLSYFRIDRDILWILVKLGVPQVIRSTLVRFSMMWVNASANAYGMVISETNSVGNKLQKFLELFIQGVDGASAAMVGQNLGAKKLDRAGKVTLCTLAATLVCATGVSLLCLVCPEEIFGIFTKNPQVRQLGAVYLQIMIVHFYSSAVVGAFQAMVTGCGFVTLGFAIGILDGVVCKIGSSLFFVHVLGMGHLGLFWGVACSRILPGILCGGYYFSGKWRTRRLLSES